MTGRINILIASLIIVAGLFSASLFVVDQRQYALIFQFRKVTRIIKEPGLYFKIPLIQAVKLYDRRILTIDANDDERFLTSEKQNVMVDTFIKWRIANPEKFYESVGGDEKLAANRLQQTINDSLRAEFGKRTLHEVISGERERITEILRYKANLDAQKIGVQVLDVRLKRVGLPQEVSESVYRRMEAERQRVANELRSEGSAEAEKISADADRQREVILAEAYNKAQELIGAGDAQASSIYAAAYGKNPEFYAFYKSLEAYKQSMKNKSDVLVLEPNSEFFKYFKNSGKTGK